MSEYEVQLLDTAECRRLLGGATVGCIALPGAQAPELRPVNFCLRGDAIIVRTGESMLLDAAERGDMAAFEVHGIDGLEHTGWSVVATGKLSKLEKTEQTLALPLRAWASGTADRLVALSLEQVSGRRIPPGRGNR